MLSLDLFPRAVLALEIVLLGMSIYLLYHSSLRYEYLTRKLLAELGQMGRGRYVLVYFSAPTCAVCKSVQRPAIEKLSTILGDSLQVLEIDTTKQPELASRWGVLVVPATYLINPRGELQRVNHGLAQAEELLMQMHTG